MELNKGNENAANKKTPDLEPVRFRYEWQSRKRGFFKRRKRIIATQEEFSLGQEVELMNLMHLHDLGSLQDLNEKKLTAILDNFVASGKIINLFQILLMPRLNTEELKAMPLTIQGRVVADFLALNPVLTILARSFLGGIRFSREKVAAEPAKDSPPKE